MTVGTCAAWLLRGHIFSVLQWPALQGAHLAGITDFNFRIFEPAGGLSLMLYGSLLLGVVFAAPLCLGELWYFISPALTLHERRVALLLVPGALVLFLAGAAFCYAISPVFFSWLFAFNRSLGVAPEVALLPYLRFFLQCLVVFGLSFELPLVMMFLVFIGVMDSQAMLAKWRGAVVIITIIAAVVTPTTDPFTMTLMAAPMVLLYFLSIFLARLVEKQKSNG